MQKIKRRGNKLYGFGKTLPARALLWVFMILWVPVMATEVTVYRTPECGCCGKWAEHLEQAGFDVTLRSMQTVAPLKAQLGVPRELQSCHTAEVEGYVIEGHVPAVDIRRLLQERPSARGLAVPGMPIGAPGMEMGSRKDAYEVILFGAEPSSIFATH